MRASPSVSIVIPLFNESTGIDALIRRVTTTVAGIPGDDPQVILVDDGSSDETWDAICVAARQHKMVLGTRLSRNFGHQSACAAGLTLAKNDVCVVMDGDLQDPPETIPRMIQRYREGFDVVYAVRKSRQESWPLRFCYYAFYRLMAMLSDRPMPLDSGDFCLMSRKVYCLINAAKERSVYLRGLRAWVGFRQIGIDVDRERRQSGESKYSWRKLFALAINGIFSHSVIPMRAALAFGGLAVFVSFLIGIHAIYGKLILGTSPPGYTALVVTMVFFAGVQLLFLGVIGEYVGRIFEEVKGRPSFIIGETFSKEHVKPSGSDAAEQNKEEGEAS
ncbi:MAG: glycosyltransferase family 2 protein [Planctomycetota bacterium]